MYKASLNFCNNSLSVGSVAALADQFIWPSRSPDLMPLDFCLVSHKTVGLWKSDRNRRPVLGMY